MAVPARLGTSLLLDCIAMTLRELRAIAYDEHMVVWMHCIVDGFRLRDL